MQARPSTAGLLLAALGAMAAWPTAAIAHAVAEGDKGYIQEMNRPEFMISRTSPELKYQTNLGRLNPPDVAIPIQRAPRDGQTQSINAN